VSIEEDEREELTPETLAKNCHPALANSSKSPPRDKTLAFK
jgi:hypothetical protein